MKYFLIVYETQSGQVQELTVFDDSAGALEARLEREKEHAAESTIEVALLRAESEEALHESHARYFSSLGSWLSGSGTRKPKRNLSAVRNPRLCSTPVHSRAYLPPGRTQSETDCSLSDYARGDSRRA